MTAIAFRDGVMAGDTACWRDAGRSSYIGLHRPKVIRLSSGVFGAAGDSLGVKFDVGIMSFSPGYGGNPFPWLRDL
jgi:hypothetical protein